MLGDEMAGTGVQASGEETRHYQIDERFPAAVINKQGVKHKLESYVDSVPFCRLLSPNKARTKGVEENLEGAVHKLRLYPKCTGVTYQKNVFPATLLRRSNSRRVGRSVSTPSTPICLWCSR